MKPKLGTLLLAAGGSIRLGRSKQLIRFRGQSLVRRAARLLLELEPAIAVAVVGAEAAAVAEELAGLALIIHENPDWPAGMGGSIAAGMRGLPAQSDGVLILLCDQWRIDGGDLAKLRAAWTADPSQVVVAGWGDSFGPPAIFPQRLFGELRALSGDAGAKALIKANRRSARFITLANAQFDLDGPGDLELLRASEPGDRKDRPVGIPPKGVLR